MGGLEGEWFLELTTVRNPVVLHEHSPAGALQEALPTGGRGRIAQSIQSGAGSEIRFATQLD